MNLSVIIVNWNSADYTVSCVSSIEAQTKGLEFEIIVVDNASTDDSCCKIQEHCPSVRLIRSRQNLGFARANNLGFQHSSGGILLFLNPDTELCGPAINLMYECLAASPDIGMLGCRLLNSDLSLQTSCIHRFPTIVNQIADAEHLRRLLPHVKLWGMHPLFNSDREKPVAVEAISGACQMIRREVFEKVGLFSTDYFMYMEDLDLCRRVQEIGTKVCYLGSATIVHHGGKSSQKRGGEDFSGPMMKESIHKFLRKTRGPVYSGLYRLSICCLSLLRLSVLTLLSIVPSEWLHKNSIRHSFLKWYGILRWSVGLEAWARRPTTRPQHSAIARSQIKTNSFRSDDMSQSKPIRYTVITPARDEARHIGSTIASVIQQTLRPVEWVIVNDGSTDETGEIIDHFAAQHNWITVVHLPNRGLRENATGVMHAFYCGYDALHSSEWDFIVKLDGDLSFDAKYFENCLNEFEQNPKLGIGGGLICHLDNGVLRPETCPRFHVRGATKIYRRECWHAIGGLLKSPGWDTVDEVKANMLSWETRTFRNLLVHHHRHTGAADGAWKNSVKDGVADYISGYHPLFMVLKCFKRLVRKPYIVGSVGLSYGFVSGYLRGTPQVGEPALIDYLRKQQLRRLMLLDSIWR